MSKPTTPDRPDEQRPTLDEELELERAGLEPDVPRLASIQEYDAWLRWLETRKRHD